MANYSTNEFKAGLKIMLDGDPYNIVENEFVKPGKGQAFNRVKVRNLKTGRVIERTFKSGDSVEAADVHETEMQYLYKDENSWHFMHPETFEQLQADQAAVADADKWMLEQALCTVVLWNGNIISVTAPNFVELKVVDTDPGLRGDTSGGGGKPATLETGAVVRVPLFMNIGDVIRVDTNAALPCSPLSQSSLASPSTSTSRRPPPKKRPTKSSLTSGTSRAAQRRRQKRQQPRPLPKTAARKTNKARLTRAASSSLRSAPSAAKRTPKTWTSTPLPRKSNKSRLAWRAALANCAPSSIAAPSV